MALPLTKMGKVGYVCFKTKDWMGMFETYITSNGREFFRGIVIFGSETTTGFYG